MVFSQCLGFPVSLVWFFVVSFLSFFSWLVLWRVCFCVLVLTRALFFLSWCDALRAAFLFLWVLLSLALYVSCFGAPSSTVWLLCTFSSLSRSPSCSSLFVFLGFSCVSRVESFPFFFPHAFVFLGFFPLLLFVVRLFCDGFLVGLFLGGLFVS